MLNAAHLTEYVCSQGLLSSEGLCESLVLAVLHRRLAARPLTSVQGYAHGQAACAHSFWVKLHLPTIGAAIGVERLCVQGSKSLWCRAV